MSREVEEKRSRKEVGEKRLLLFSRWERRVLCALYTDSHGRQRTKNL